MTLPSNYSTDELLALTPHLRSLARRLVGDAHRAEDLVQETWAHALEDPPSEARVLRHWLAVVLRNLAFQDHRTGARRRAREEAVAREESSTALAESRERLALYRVMIETIDELGEPYQDAIVLRYFDGLSPRAIAARLDVPVKTVKTRLHRGLSLLRGKLDQSYGRRSAWVVALAPVTEMVIPVSLSVALTTYLKVAAIVIAGFGIYVLLPDRDARP